MTRWTPTEDAVLLDYGRVPTRDLAARLPRRTLRSIYARAHIALSSADAKRSAGM